MKWYRTLAAFGAAAGALLLGWSLNSGQAQTVASDEAVIKVQVPDGATVRIGKQTSTQTGKLRTFYTGKLLPGFSYQYEFIVTWKVLGKEQRVSQWITVRPGETKTVVLGPEPIRVIPKKEPPKKEPPKKEPPKKEPPKKEPPKKEPPKKKVDPKKEPTKKVDPKKVDPKKEPTKKVDSKKVEPKKVDPKKVDPKKEPTKKVDPKKIDPKKVDPKGETPGADLPKSRAFLFSYGGAVTGLKPGQEASIWLPVPLDSPLQDVKIVEKNIPGKESLGQDKEFGNRMLHFVGRADDKGQVPFNVIYQVRRKEMLSASDGKITSLTPGETREQIARFLESDKLIPLKGKTQELIKGKIPSDQFVAARALYDLVEKHMVYAKKGKGWGRGDAEWACQSKFGNCTDFHSLFISLARGSKIPSKFVMGFSIPPKRGMGPVEGYHCWAWFLPEGKGWLPVDITEGKRQPEMRDYFFGNLNEDRVQFTTGRDIRLVPEQKGPALNYFIYPYVEVNGQPYPEENIARRFEYLDE